MLRLSDDLMFAQGKCRWCYVHPDDPSRCVKIDRPGHRSRATAREAAYYHRLSRLRPMDRLRCIPRFYGMTPTDRGVGGVFELVRDENDRSLSPTLGEFLKSAGHEDLHRLRSAVTEFRDELLAHTIVVRDVHAENLCVKRRRDRRLRVVAVDGIGHRDFIPLCDYWRPLGLQKTRRYIDQQGLDSLDRLVDYCFIHRPLRRGKKPQVERTILTPQRHAKQRAAA